QAQSLPADVRVDIDPGTGTYQPATAMTGGDSLGGLQTSPDGASYTFHWNTTHDVPHATVANVKVRVSATVAFVSGSGGRTIIRTITVRNGVMLAPAIDHAVDTSASWWALGDVNRDGHVDVVVGSFSFTSTLLLGDGQGGFIGGGVALPLGNIYHYGRLVDVNADGKLDLVLVAYGSGALSVCLGNGDGTFGGAGVIDATGGSSTTG